MMVDRSLAVRAVAATFVSIAFVAVCLRVYCRSRVVKSFGWDDGLMVAAMLFYIMYSGSMIGGSLYGTGKRFEDITPRNALMAMRYWWLCEIGYCFSSVFCKASVCVFLLRITVRRLHNWILYLVMFFTVATGLLFMFLMLLQCQPLSLFWTRVGPNPPTDGSCMNIDGIIAMTYVYSVFTAICDLTAGILPIFLVWNLNMDFNLKVAVVGILSLACIASAAVIARFPFVNTFADPEFLYATVEIAILSNVENGLGITAGSLATLRPLLRHIKGEVSSTGYLNGATNVKSTRRDNQQNGSLRRVERRSKPANQVQTTTVGDFHRLDDLTGSEDSVRLDSSHKLEPATKQN